MHQCEFELAVAVRRDGGWISKRLLYQHFFCRDHVRNSVHSYDNCYTNSYCEPWNYYPILLTADKLHIFYTNHSVCNSRITGGRWAMQALNNSWIRRTGSHSSISSWSPVGNLHASSDSIDHWMGLHLL